MRISSTLIALMVAVLGSACNAAIGDGCTTSGDRASDGGRVCDTNQPGGYCTITPCDPDTCPGEAACVEWRFDPNRTAQTWCMLVCGGGCRAGYACARPSQIPEDGLTSAFTADDDGDGNIDNPDLVDPVARIIDVEQGVENIRICAALRE